MPMLKLLRALPRLTLWLAAMLCGHAAVAADSLTNSQRDAATAYFAALASGDAQSLAFAIHPDEITQLRLRLLTRLREEATHDDGTLRGRLFGTAMPLAELERMTAQSFFVALSRRLSFGGRNFRDVRWVGAINESKSLVWVVGRLRPPKELGTVEVVQMVGLMPYGKDWKAIIPTQLEAQIEDLLTGRAGPAAAPPSAVTSSATAPSGAGGGNAAAATTAATAASGAAAGVKGATAPREMLQLLEGAEQALIAGKCDSYYKDFLSPNFRRLTPAKALDTLILSCSTSLGMRETLIAALRIVRGLSPQLELEATRATYDVSNQGLPYDRFVLEKIQGRWYIAE